MCNETCATPERLAKMSCHIAADKSRVSSKVSSLVWSGLVRRRDLN